MIGIDTLQLKVKGRFLPSAIRQIPDQGGTLLKYYNKGGRQTDWCEQRIDSVAIKHTIGSDTVIVEIDSCAGFLYGNSMIPIEEKNKEQFLNELQHLLFEAGIELLAPLLESIPLRADMKHDFHMGDFAADITKVLATGHEVPGHMKTVRAGTTIEYENSCRVMKVYDRYANCLNKQKSQEETEMSKGVLRFEVVCNAAELRRQMKMKVVRLEDILHSSVTEALVTKYLDMMQLNNLRISTESQMRRLLSETHGKSVAERIISYVRAVMDGRLDDYSRTTGNNYKRYIKEAGLVPVISHKEIPLLQLPWGVQRELTKVLNTNNPRNDAIEKLHNLIDTPISMKELISCLEKIGYKRIS